VGLNVLLGWNQWPGVLAGQLSVAPWNTLLEALRWVLALPFAGIFGWRRALFGAGVAIGPLAAGALGVALAFAARPFSKARFLWLVPAVAALLPGLHRLALPGMVDDRTLLLALIALTAGLLARGWNGDTGWAFLAGLAGGVAIWLTPEAVPLVLSAYAMLLFRWVQEPIGIGLAAGAAGFFDVLGFGFAVGPPPGGYGVVAIDRLSVVYVVMALLLLIGALGLWRLQRWRQVRSRRVAGIGLMAGLLLGWVALFPKLLPAACGILNPMNLPPVHGVTDLLVFSLPGALALLYLGYGTLHGGARWWIWAYAALGAAVALLLGQRFGLFVGFSNVLAAGLVPVALTEVNLKRARGSLFGGE
jgi:hypothetical protein